MKPFLRRLDQCLQEYGRKRPWLAQETGIPLNTINAWFQGDRSPRVEDAYKVAKVLIRPMEWFITGGKQIMQTDLRTLFNFGAGIVYKTIQEFPLSDHVPILRFMAKVMDELPMFFPKDNGEIAENIEKLSKLVSNDVENTKSALDVIDILSSSPMEKFAKQLNKEFSKEQRSIIIRALYMWVRLLSKERLEKDGDKWVENLNNALKRLEDNLVSVQLDEIKV